MQQQQQQQQQQGAMFRTMPPSFPAANITTEQIQKYLDENKKLILAILDNQNLGKLAECAQYQAQLQKNLMYLAAIADGQSQTPTMAPQVQMSHHPAMQQGAFFMQHPQAAAMAQQQPGMFTQRAPFSSPLPVQDPHLQHLAQQLHPQANLAQTPMRPVGPTNSIQPSQNDANIGPGPSNMPTSNPGLTDIHSGNKQDRPDASSDGHGNSGVAHGGEEEPK